MHHLHHEILLRVRYADTDQMGTYYNARVFEWFECGRTELLRSVGKSYREMEQDGFRMPVSEAHAEFLGPAQYDDLLRVSSRLFMPGRARFRFDVEIAQADSRELVARGYTIHVTTDATGKPIRPPRSLVDLIEHPGKP